MIINLRCWSCGALCQMEGPEPTLGVELQHAAVSAGWIGVVDYGKRRVLVFCSDECHDAAITKDGQFRARSPGVNILPRLEALLSQVLEAHESGAGVGGLPANAAGYLTGWIEALDYQLTRFQQRVPLEQRAPYIEKLLACDDPMWIVYMSDGGYTRIKIDLFADRKVAAVELTNRSRPRWDAWANPEEDDE